jgi:hypothetical protein
VLFNLSQAQGKAFKLDDHSPTLAAAQRADGEIVAELTLLQGSEIAGFTADLPLPKRALWERVLATNLGEPLAIELRSALAPGSLGRSPQLAAGAIAAVAVASLIGASRWRPSHHCARCGRRMCPRCEPELGRARDCESCNRLFHQPETTDRALRAARLGALRYREQRLARVRLVASLLVPGLAGALARRPWPSLLGALSASLAALAIVGRNGVTPDPLIAGAAGPLAFGSLAALALLGYSASLAFALGARKRG